MSNIDDKIKFEPTGFDYVNPKTEVVIVGITPGNSQLNGEREGLDYREIKRRNAFAGSMRPNLIKMLDHVGVNRLLNIETCKSLWEEDFDRVEMTSLLKEATYIIRKSGKKDMFKEVELIAKSELLTEKFESGFVKDCSSYNNAKLFVACGPKVYEKLQELKGAGVINVPVIGIAHPSSANLGRVLCYLGLKEAQDPSYKWCVEKAKEAQILINGLVEKCFK